MNSSAFALRESRKRRLTRARQDHARSLKISLWQTPLQSFDSRCLAVRRGPAQKDRGGEPVPRLPHVICWVPPPCQGRRVRFSLWWPAATQLAPDAAQTSACAAGITTFAQMALARGFARRSTRTGRALALRQDGAVATAEFA